MSIHVPTYRRFRSAGYSPVDSIRNSRILSQFNSLDGYSIELQTDSDCDIFDMDFEDTPAERKRLIELANNLGVWGVVATSPDGDTIDSVWGCWGYQNPDSPFENWYVPDLMQACIDHAADVHERELQLSYAH